MDRKYNAQQVLGGRRDEKKVEADPEKGPAHGVFEGTTDEKKAEADPDKGQAEV